MILTAGFRPRVCPEGYEWRDGKLFAKSLERVDKKSLFKKGDFYETLARVGINEESILNFVSEHGFLFQQPREVIGFTTSYTYSETLEDWKENLKVLKDAVEKFLILNDVSHRKELSKHSNVITADTFGACDDSIKVTFDKSDSFIATGQDIGNGRTALNHFRPATSSTFPVETAIKENIALSARPYLDLYMEVTTQVGFNEESLVEYQPVVKPKNLLGACWWQLVNSLPAKRFRECVVCGALIDMTHRRSDVKTCSDKCRVRKSEQTKYTHDTPTDSV